MNEGISKLLAQVPSPLGPIGSGPGFGVINNSPQFVDNCGPINTLAHVVSVVIGFMTIVAGIYFMFQFLFGAIGWISASGDKNKLTTAQTRITQAMLGLIMVVAAYAITALFQTITGLDILLQNPGDLLRGLMLGTAPSC